MKIHKHLLAGCLILVLTPLASASDEMGSLKNLERERARLLELALSSETDSVQRQQQIQQMSYNMVDLERMVLRDDRLLGLSDPSVKRAFNDYDLTFISHASIESKQHIVDFWLEQLGLSSARITEARVGLR